MLESHCPSGPSLCWTGHVLCKPLFSSIYIAYIARVIGSHPCDIFSYWTELLCYRWWPLCGVGRSTSWRWFQTGWGGSRTFSLRKLQLPSWPPVWVGGGGGGREWPSALVWGATIISIWFSPSLNVRILWGGGEWYFTNVGFWLVRFVRWAGTVCSLVRGSATLSCSSSRDWPGTRKVRGVQSTVHVRIQAQAWHPFFVHSDGDGDTVPAAKRIKSEDILGTYMYIYKKFTSLCVHVCVFVALYPWSLPYFTWEGLGVRLPTCTVYLNIVWCHNYIIPLDLDELEVYGSSEAQSGGTTSLASYKFEVCDSLLNIGPIKDMTLGMPAFLSVS